MSREDRRTESTATRIALLERDLDVHDAEIAATVLRDDEQDDRLDALELRSSANRAATWANIATIMAAFLAAVGGVVVAVLTA